MQQVRTMPTDLLISRSVGTDSWFIGRQLIAGAHPATPPCRVA